MKCPKCEFEQAESAECIRCGLIFAKYRPRPPRPVTQPSTPTNRSAPKKQPSSDVPPAAADGPRSPSKSPPPVEARLGASFYLSGALFLIVIFALWWYKPAPEINPFEPPTAIDESASPAEPAAGKKSASARPDNNPFPTLPELAALTPKDTPDGSKPAVADAPPAPPPPVPSAPPPPPVSSRWYTGAEFDDALREQKSTGASLLLLFRVDWCPHCVKLDQLTLPDRQVQAALERVVKVRIDPEKSPADKALGSKFGVTGYPTLLLLERAEAAPMRLSRGNGPQEFAAGVLSAKRGLSDHLVTRGHGTGQIADLDRAVRIDVDNPQAYYFRGMARFKSDELDGAVQDFGKTFELQPERLQALDYLAMSHLKRHDPDQAIRELDRLITLDPRYGNGRAHSLRSFAYYQKRDLPHARESAKAACDLGLGEGCAALQQLGK